MKLFPRLKLSPRLIKFAYRFVDLESVSETASPDERIIEYSFIIEKLASTTKGKVLDVGCTARINCLPATLASLGWQVWGIDMREFKFNHTNFKFVFGDIRETDFPDNFFDAVYAVSTLEHIGLNGRYGVTNEDPKGDAKAATEIARILRPDGVLLCTLPYAREVKIIRRLQKIYDKSSLDRLFSNWTRRDERWYYQKDDSYWTLLSEEDALKVENPGGNSAVVLLELSHVK